MCPFELVWYHVSCSLVWTKCWNSLPELAVLDGACARLHGDDAKLDGAPGSPGAGGWGLNDRHQPLTEALVAPRVVTLRPVLAVRVPYCLASLHGLDPMSARNRIADVTQTASCAGQTQQAAIAMMRTSSVAGV